MSKCNLLHIESCRLFSLPANYMIICLCIENVQSQAALKWSFPSVKILYSPTTTTRDSIYTLKAFISYL